ncbi:YdeI/OmpD-associated family protein [Ureibacillus sp. NPDC094379]
MANSIVEKLKLQKYKSVALINVPEGSHYFDELTDYQTELGSNSFELIFVFVLNMEELQAQVKAILENNNLNQKGYVFLAYPKKGNKVYSSYIHRDDLFEGLGAGEDGYIRESTIKFARMVALDDIFTVVGLKEDSKARKVESTKASQCVDDYIELIPQIEKDLEDAPEQLAFYHSLTFGYRKDWARYVYSAKQEVTREKRRQEMKKILSEGYKTRDLYKLGKK